MFVLDILKKKNSKWYENSLSHTKKVAVLQLNVFPGQKAWSISCIAGVREGCLMLKVRNNKVCECAILSLLNETLGKGYMIESKIICIADSTLDH